MSLPIGLRKRRRPACAARTRPTVSARAGSWRRCIAARPQVYQRGPQSHCQARFAAARKTWILRSAPAFAKRLSREAPGPCHLHYSVGSTDQARGGAMVLQAPLEEEEVAVVVAAARVLVLAANSSAQ